MYRKSRRLGSLASSSSSSDSDEEEDGEKNEKDKTKKKWKGIDNYETLDIGLSGPI